MKFKTISQINSCLIERFDSTILTFLRQYIQNNQTIKQYETIQAFYLNLKQNLPEIPLKKETLNNFLKQQQRNLNYNKTNQIKKDLTKILSAEADLSYMKSEILVGSYNPDKSAKLNKISENRDDDCVRCICGIIEDDGGMTQCDSCYFWLHDDCLDTKIDSNKVSNFFIYTYKYFF